MDRPIPRHAFQTLQPQRDVLRIRWLPAPVTQNCFFGSFLHSGIVVQACNERNLPCPRYRIRRQPTRSDQLTREDSSPDFRVVNSHYRAVGSEDGCRRVSATLKLWSDHAVNILAYRKPTIQSTGGIGGLVSQSGNQCEARKNKEPCQSRRSRGIPPQNFFAARSMLSLCPLCRHSWLPERLIAVFRPLSLNRVIA